MGRVMMMMLTAIIRGCTHASCTTSCRTHPAHSKRQGAHGQSYRPHTCQYAHIQQQRATNLHSSPRRYPLTISAKWPDLLGAQTHEGAASPPGMRPSCYFRCTWDRGRQAARQDRREGMTGEASEAGKTRRGNGDMAGGGDTGGDNSSAHKPCQTLLMRPDPRKRQESLPTARHIRSQHILDTNLPAVCRGLGIRHAASVCELLGHLQMRLQKFVLVESKYIIHIPCFFERRSLTCIYLTRVHSKVAAFVLLQRLSSAFVLLPPSPLNFMRDCPPPVPVLLPFPATNFLRIQSESECAK